LGFVRDLGWLWPREIFQNFQIFTKIDLGQILEFREFISYAKNTTSSNPKSYIASNAITSTCQIFKLGKRQQ